MVRFGGRDVAAPVGERAEQLVATDRDEGDVHANRVQSTPGVQRVFEQLPGVVGDAVLRGLVEKIVGLAEGHEHAHVAALDHAVEVALPGSQQLANRFVRRGLGWRCGLRCGWGCS